MRRAQEITDEAFKAILNFIRPGLTEREIAARLVYELLRRGGEQVSFDPIVAAGPNGSRPHARAPEIRWWMWGCSLPWTSAARWRATALT